MMQESRPPQPILPLSQTQRANAYPYEAPAQSYLIKEGHTHLVEAFSAADLAGRVAVLSVGSNRAPQQLLRKFGQSAYLPVTRAVLHDCDIIHSACFSYYGAVPCSAVPSVGTAIALNAVWLTAEELQIMHDTEAVGIAYDFCRWQAGKVTIKDAPQPDVIYGYATRLGFVADAHGRPFSLSSLPAEGRRFQALSQHDARLTLIGLLPKRLQCACADSFIVQLTSDKSFRLAVNEALAAIGKPISQGPWDILPATPNDADRFL